MADTGWEGSSTLEVGTLLLLEVGSRSLVVGCHSGQVESCKCWEVGLVHTGNPSSPAEEGSWADCAPDFLPDSPTSGYCHLSLDLPQAVRRMEEAGVPCWDCLAYPQKEGWT